MANVLKIYQYGIVEQDTRDWWESMKSMSTLDASALSPFIRITPLIMIGSDIIAHKKSALLDMYSSQMKTKNYTGGYALKSMNFDIHDSLGATFDIKLEFNIFDLGVFEKSAESGLYFLSNLNSRLKLEFGWGKYMWPLKEESTTDTVVKHGGKGQELYCAVVKSNIGISDEQIITFSVTLRAPSSLIMKQWRNDYGFDLNQDKLGQSVSYFKRKKYFTWLTGGVDIIKAIRLEDLTKHITESVQKKLYKIGMNSQTAPVFDVSHPIDKNTVLNPSIEADVGMTEKSSNSAITVGDIMISLSALKDLLPKTKTTQGFMKAVLSLINSAGGGSLKLDMTQSLNGSKIVIVNSANASGEEKVSNEDIWSRRDEYLNFNFADGNTLVKSITFDSDIEASSLNQMNFIQKQGLEEASNAELLSFMSTWYETTDVWENASYDERMAKKDEFEKNPSNLFNEVLRVNKSIENVEALREEFAKVVESIIVMDNTLKYLPYTMEVSLIGMADIWKGTRLLLDDRAAIPLYRNTVWRITSISHELSDGNWTTNFTAICEWNEEINRKNQNLMEAGRKPFGALATPVFGNLEQ